MYFLMEMSMCVCVCVYDSTHSLFNGIEYLNKDRATVKESLDFCIYLYIYIWNEDNQEVIVYIY